MKKPPVSRRLVVANPYFAIRYMRSPASFLDDSTVSLIFFVTCPLMNPRML